MVEILKDKTSKHDEQFQFNLYLFSRLWHSVKDGSQVQLESANQMELPVEKSNDASQVLSTLEEYKSFL